MMACVCIPRFAAAVEARENPALCGAPLVIVETTQQRERVYAVSEAGSKAGVCTGMSLRQAQTLCPEGRLIFAEHARYQRAFEVLLETLSLLSPCVEPEDLAPSAIAYLDLADQKNREPVDVAQVIGHTIREEALLSPALGLAAGKFTAYVAASTIEPHGASIIAPGQERSFLAPFPVDLLPLDADTTHQLNLLGIRTLGQLAELPASAVLAQFGKQGGFLHKLVRGQDDRPLIPHQFRSGEKVLYQCDGPVSDWRVLERILKASIADLSKRLYDKGMAARQVRLVLRMDDGHTQDGTVTMNLPTWGQGRLMGAVTELVNQAPISSGITEFEIHLCQLVPAVGHQLDLFVEGARQEGRLRDALKDLAKRHGSRCFYRTALDSQDEPVLEFRFRVRSVDVA